MQDDGRRVPRRRPSARCGLLSSRLGKGFDAGCMPAGPRGHTGSRGGDDVRRTGDAPQGWGRFGVTSRRTMRAPHTAPLARRVAPSASGAVLLPAAFRRPCRPASLRAGSHALSGRLRARAVQSAAGRSGRRVASRGPGTACAASRVLVHPGTGKPRPGLGVPRTGLASRHSGASAPVRCARPHLGRWSSRAPGQAGWGGAWPSGLLNQSVVTRGAEAQNPSSRSRPERRRRRDPARAGCARRASGIAWGARGLHLGGTLDRPPHRRPPAWMKLSPDPTTTLLDSRTVCPRAGRGLYVPGPTR
jgi:hypothetical protein